MHGSLPRHAALVPARRLALPLVLRLALRELRGGLHGFGIFLACIALGVAAIAGVSSISRSLTEGLAREGRKILGGDMAFSLVHREASPAGARLPRTHAARSRSIASMRAMAMAGDKGSGLVELKAVDGAYPTVGELADRAAAAAAADLLAERDGAFGAVVDAALLARLDLKLGDRVTSAQRGCRAARDPRLRARQDRERHRLRAAPPRLAGGAARHRASSSPAAWCAGPTASTCRRAPRTRALERIEAEAARGAAGGRLGDPLARQRRPALRPQHRALHASS